MKIGTRAVGSDSSPYLIAEIGVNHDGDVNRAVELTRQAAKAGADAVKLQFFRADLLMSRASGLAAYQEAAGERDPHSMLRRLELSVDQMRGVVDAAHDAGIHAIVTVFSTELVAEAEGLAWDAYKSASPDVVNKPLLTAMGATGRPLIVSTGAATIDEVARAAGWLRGLAGRLAFLQCVSSYPTPDELAELGGIGAIADVFDGPVGYSDHTTGVETGAKAVWRGASILEKHLTYSREAVGPDHAASLIPAEFAQYVESAKRAWTERQARRRPKNFPEPARKRVLTVEEDVRRLSRQSLVTRRALPAGHVLSRADLTIKRPGTGLEPWMLESTIGRRLSRAVEADVPVTIADLAKPAAREAA
jgi:N-acetylneuraminate synthase/N,N'-diacetyllegionaminate synthase